MQGGAAPGRAGRTAVKPLPSSRPGRVTTAAGTRQALAGGSTRGLQEEQIGEVISTSRV